MRHPPRARRLRRKCFGGLPRGSPSRAARSGSGAGEETLPISRTTVQALARRRAHHRENVYFVLVKHRSASFSSGRNRRRRGLPGCGRYRSPARRVSPPWRRYCGEVSREDRWGCSLNGRAWAPPPRWYHLLRFTRRARKSGTISFDVRVVK